MSAAAPRKRYYISVRIKLVVGFTLLFSLIFTAAAYSIYQLETADMLASIETEMVNTLNGALPGIDGEALAGLMAEGQPNPAGFSDDPRYLAQIEWFEHMHVVQPRAWLYTFVPGETPGMIVYAADGWMRVEPDHAARFREQSSEDEAMLDCFKQQETFMNPFTDQWGTWVSACVPVRNSGGEVIGALGVDFEYDQVAALQRRILTNIAVVFVLGYVIGVLLVYFIAGMVSRPLVRLAREAEGIGQGNYRIDVSDLNAGVVIDEISTLADRFSVMAAKVGEREARLVSEVQQLRIQIDEGKRAQQVQEITNTEDFQSLRARAAEMRARRAQMTGDDPGKESTDE